ncbi:hypothetical protein [Gordonia sp. OPL2]|uniref:hypothetical protein n=1 Tax=Gordonia sp. OPL2 TaxID=2486274 RepID=UPI001655927A|nr:hypothetical protein [Gordonia sp. OPL2]ROZ98107.1 hypothetical protein EEB19_16110 [Gordonia sp. OPL2]
MSAGRPEAGSEGDDVIGTTGVVTLAIPGGDTLGEVELAVGGGTERYLAAAVEPVELDRTVLVVGVRPGRVVDVEPWIAAPS